MKRIGIVGSRRRDAHDDFTKCLSVFQSIYDEGDRIVSGGCPKGGDRFAEILADQLATPIEIFYAEWDKYGRGAGFKRNTYIAQASDVLIACVAADRTGGTEDTVRKFQKLRPTCQLILV